ncbi:hypothetical protein [Anabaena sp. CCY 9910]|uniref:hypothetical protein n=1 Tax=Anabaena sp. CCY 9910 TaxID=3103870 RepID=UPI0039DF66EE
MSKFYNNVKSRLNKKGLTGFVKTDYQEAAEHLRIADLDNVTTDQIIAGFEYLAAKRENQIQPTAPLTPQESPHQIQHYQEAETIAQQELELLEIEPIAPLEELTKENQIVLSNADKQALVTSQSLALGFELSEDETTEIADSIDDVFADYSSFVNGVTTAIRQYIAHKFDTIESDLSDNTNDIREYLNNRTNRLNQKVLDYAEAVKAIQKDTQVIRDNLKTSKEVILSRFRVK